MKPCCQRPNPSHLAGMRPRPPEFATLSTLLSLAACLYTKQGPGIRAERLRARGLDEYVVLANCISNAGVRSSQMAYFPGSPNASPNVVAQTSYGQTSVWENSVTSGRFDDGNVFTSTIGPPVPQGEFAGTGQASQGSFSCWKNYRTNLYNWAEHLCTGIYDCNRKGRSFFLSG